MASVVEICNRALQRLGAKRITSLTQDSANARSMNVAYAPTRDALLRKYIWSFAIKRAQLAEDATGPLFTYENSFTLPTDFIRLVYPDSSNNYNTLDWVIEGGRILTNDSAPLNIRYVARIEDPNLMDSTFREALSAALAESTCEEITQSNTKYQLVSAWARDAIATAKSTGAIEKKAVLAPDSTWITSRA